MDNPKRIYELLLDYCSTETVADRLLIGLVWTMCQSSNTIGLSMSPQFATRTLSWSGDLAGKSLIDLAAWILEWEPYQASVAMSAINTCLNTRAMPDSIALDNRAEDTNLTVFEYFLPQLSGKNVVVVGRYPGIERYQDQIALTILEKEPGIGDYPDAACEHLIPGADWVFLTASSIPNKTFPRLAELATHAKTVLMGPTTPWLPQLHEFGINYLAGIEVTEPETLYRTIAEGGGKRIFSKGLRYRIAELTPYSSMAWLKQQIADCAAEKNRLTQQMDKWYGNSNRQRFPGYALLDKTTTRLSRMDSSYKHLWDQYGNVESLTGKIPVL
jgi:uncharacterized protein (DUF4213/DUF364 family)